ncbi:MAG: hypothetical protein RJR35_09370 [Thermoanaerobacterales bacterium]|jgi:hypothetical protein|nr:hypothetical protein [Thermoanaerobacterales bacterium]
MEAGKFLERTSDVFKKWSSAAKKEIIKEQQHVVELKRKVGKLTYKVDCPKNSFFGISGFY